MVLTTRAPARAARSAFHRAATASSSSPFASPWAATSSASPVALLRTAAGKRFPPSRAPLPGVARSGPPKRAASSSAAGEPAKATEKTSLWKSAQFWGGAGALAGWGMSGAAIYDATQSGPDVISMNMTSVLIVYSSLFARWAWVVQPRNLALCACHVTNVAAQLNQLRRALEHKRGTPEGEKEVQSYLFSAGGFAAGVGALVAAGPALRARLVGAELGPVSVVAAAAAGPFTVHFWAPMSKWFISGASFLDLNRPTDKISLAQYSALTLTGFFFSRYAMLVTPINYLLASVNVALFGSSAWHLGRKVKADYVDK
jgi:mitochondrial pyruvate carrier 2